MNSHSLFSDTMHDELILALPKGRVSREALVLLETMGVIPEDAFFDENARALKFATNIPQLQIIQVRSFDVATFVAFGAAQIGICGLDVLMEFDYSEIYTPLDLKIAPCRISVAQPAWYQESNIFDTNKVSHLRVATKYPHISHKYFERFGIQAECIKLNGSIELAPNLGVCNHIVDLVSTGSTLKANGLVEVQCISKITSRLIVNRVAMKTRSAQISYWINRFQEILNAQIS